MLKVFTCHNENRPQNLMSVIVKNIHVTTNWRQIIYNFFELKLEGAQMKNQITTKYCCPSREIGG